MGKQPPLGDHGLESAYHPPTQEERDTSGLSGATICGGVVVKAAIIPIDRQGTYPALVFEFHTVTGEKLKPVVLIADDDQMDKFAGLINTCASNAISQATLANG